jgi:hypothetical protein
MTFPLTTTLNRIWAYDPCDRVKSHVLKTAGKSSPDDEPVTYGSIALEDATWCCKSEPLFDALWCCRVEPQYELVWRKYAAWCARQVQHLMTDERSFEALDIAENCYNRVRDDGSYNPWDAWAAAWAAERNSWGTSQSTGWAAVAAARAISWNPASDAALGTARAAARAASFETTPGSRESTLTFQKQAFIQLVTTGTLPPHG